MADSKVIDRAKKLLKDGEPEEARDLLLKAAYGPSLNSKAQAAFEELFPAEGVLKKRLAGTLKQLKAKDVAVRRKAAATVAEEALDEVSRERSAWLKDPRTTQALTEALEDEDPQVVEKAIAALSAISQRYFADFRAYPAVVRLLGNKRLPIRLGAVTAAWALAGFDACESVIPLFQDKAEAVRGAAVIGPALLAREHKVPASAKKALCEPLAAALKDESATVRTRASNSLRELGDASVIEHLRVALAAETSVVAREAHERNIQALQKGST